MENPKIQISKIPLSYVLIVIPDMGFGAISCHIQTILDQNEASGLENLGFHVFFYRDRDPIR